MASNTPFIGNYSYTDNGVIIPDTADVQETVQEEFKAALGTDLSLEESTPQGRLIDVETTARQNTIRFNAQIVNVLVNIYSASGTVLDAWGANFDKYRKDATASTVPVTVTGAPGTVIPANSQAIADDGIIWQALNEIIIDETGEAKGVFYCSQTGVISLEAGALRTIVASTTTGIVGWETIVNTSVAEIGSDLESDTSFRERIINGLFSGSALLETMQAFVTILTESKTYIHMITQKGNLFNLMISQFLRIAYMCVLMEVMQRTLHMRFMG